MDDTLRIRILRDQDNAHLAKELAISENTKLTNISQSSGLSILQQQRRRDLDEIIRCPFHAMIEVDIETLTKKTPNELMYVHKDTITNRPVESKDKRVVIVSWSHPVVQIGLSQPLNKSYAIENSEYPLRKVNPKARGIFTKILPLVGFYEPGGQIGDAEVKTLKKTGLQSVKLGMTKQQVDAFIAGMHGVLLIQGAPGSGKTTVAFQRMRFLFDQQQEFGDDFLKNQREIFYTENRTKVYLGNSNLQSFTNRLLNELSISSDVVSLVSDAISSYLEIVWKNKQGARQRRQELPRLEIRARQAFFGLSSPNSEGDLEALWKVYEQQIDKRLQDDAIPTWENDLTDINKTTRNTLDTFHTKIKEYSARYHRSTRNNRPDNTPYCLDRLYDAVGPFYTDALESFNAESRRKFIDNFVNWCFYVYDPINAILTHFKANEQRGLQYIQNGTENRIQAKDVTSGIFKDLENRLYGNEEKPWIAWLLRFAMPQEYETGKRFRSLPWALSGLSLQNGVRYSHVVVDEAQDLSAVEASLLGSIVDPNGAFTISADFHQIVSPVKGIANPSPFKVGIPFVEKEFPSPSLLGKNMRQSRLIGLFLQSFYQAAFGEIPTFEVADPTTDSDMHKPSLVIADQIDIVDQIVFVINSAPEGYSIALIQINENEGQLKAIRNAMSSRGKTLAPIWDAFGEKGQVVTSSAEHVKGVEYDICIVIGMEEINRSNLNFTVNRAYVALSRAANRLVMLTTEFPPLLRKIENTGFSKFNVYDERAN